MTDKELRKLSRSDLIDIIYELQKNEQQLLQQLDTAQKQLASKEINIAEAGSIAEAVIGLNGIFQTAQESADQYLAQVHATNADVEARCAQLLENARQKAQAILQSAEDDSNRMKKQTDLEIAKKWSLFQNKVNALLKTHAQLKGILKRN